MAHEHRYKNVNRRIQLRGVRTRLSSDVRRIFRHIRGHRGVITLEVFSAFPWTIWRKNAENISTSACVCVRVFSTERTHLRSASFAVFHRKCGSLSISLDSFVASRHFAVWVEETARTATTIPRRCEEAAADARLNVAEVPAS
jgi:hypothetical protein